MKGIILKDFYENYIIRKNLINWILGIIMLIVVVAVFRTKYVFALSCGLVLPLLGTSMLQFSMEQDDIAHFYKLERTYPLTIRQIVLAKYILALLCIGFFLLVSFGLSFLYVYGYRGTTFREGLQIWASGLPAYLPLHYIPGLLSLWRQKGHHSVCGGNGCFSPGVRHLVLRLWRSGTADNRSDITSGDQLSGLHYFGIGKLSSIRSLLRKKN